jgi:hypothetical protein
MKSKLILAVGKQHVPVKTSSVGRDRMVLQLKTISSTLYLRAIHA